MPSTSSESARLSELLEAEEERYRASHPRSLTLAGQASNSLLNGVPMSWMTHWATPFPLFMQRAKGARLWDVDGNEYIDFCLGDTGAMAGHSPPATTEAISRRAAMGITAILPTEDAVVVGEELTCRFGLPKWQIVMTATDANRYALRLARHLTGRPKVLVFNWCYHGTVDETLAVLDSGRRVARRPGVVGPTQPAGETTRVVEFNDVDALKRELAHGDVACVITEPALTNIGIILPDPGFHDALRELTRAAGTLLLIDETHTICAGPGGMTADLGLEPDILVVGKAIGGGMPAAAYGMTEAVARVAGEAVEEPELNISGIGGTLSGNALAVAAVRATLSRTLRVEDFERMIPLAERWEAGVRDAIEECGLQWSVTRLGCRAEYWPASGDRTAAEAAAMADDEATSYLHLHALNRNVLLTPFHNMALMCPDTTPDDVDRHTSVFREALGNVASVR
jgi:glutamate-1-semialdehyde 2,1-aminomutase